MSSGSCEVEVPHFCGELITVHVAWSHYYGSYMEPPDWDEERTYFDSDHKSLEQKEEKWTVAHCPKCHVDLDCDDLFQQSINNAADKVNWGEYMEGDEQDYEPEYDDDEGKLDRDYSMDNGIDDRDEPAF